MKLVMTLLVRDEEDILDAHLRYHLSAGVDFVIATDNLSVDATPEILRTYEREGVLLRLEATDDVYDQHVWVTRMARLAATDHGADWVVNSDADEFWWPEGGNLKDVLGEVPRRRLAVSAERVNFVPRPPSEEVFFRTMTVRERSSREIAGGMAILPKVGHRGFPDVEVAQGNHHVFRPGRFRRRRLAPVPVAITIFHFPMRSYPQFANKIAKGGAALARNRTLPYDSGWTWRQQYDQLLAGELEPFYETLVRDDAAVEAGLADGSLIADERLKNALEQLLPPP